MKAADALPFVLGLATAYVVNAVGGSAAGLGYIVGVFVGGFVPFVLMPWLRRTL